MVFGYQNDPNHKNALLLPLQCAARYPAHAMTQPNPASGPMATLHSDGCWHLELRGLAPPQPMVAILRHITAHGGDGRPVIAHLERDPVMLYPELAERGWLAEPVAGDPGEVRLRLVAA